ncbi:MAG: tetratricopeptide repeat protein, partial [Mesorhizobium sp.]
NDAHATMAFVGAGQEAPVRALLEAQSEAMHGNDDNTAFTRDVGHPLTLAIKAFGDGNYIETVRLIRPIRAIAHRFGGSHAQRDVIDLTLIEAALRSGDHALASALAAERALARPDSPLSGLFSRRAADLSEN